MMPDNEYYWKLLVESSDIVNNKIEFLRDKEPSKEELRELYVLLSDLQYLSGKVLGLF